MSLEQPFLVNDWRVKGLKTEVFKRNQLAGEKAKKSVSIERHSLQPYLD